MTLETALWMSTTSNGCSSMGNCAPRCINNSSRPTRARAAMQLPVRPRMTTTRLPRRRLWRTDPSRLTRVDSCRPPSRPVFLARTCAIPGASICARQCRRFARTRSSGSYRRRSWQFRAQTRHSRRETVLNGSRSLRKLKHVNATGARH